MKVGGIVFWDMTFFIFYFFISESALVSSENVPLLFYYLVPLWELCQNQSQPSCSLFCSWKQYLSSEELDGKEKEICIFIEEDKCWMMKALWDMEKDFTYLQNIILHLKWNYWEMNYREKQTNDLLPTENVSEHFCKESKPDSPLILSVSKLNTLLQSLIALSQLSNFRSVKPSRTKIW